MHTPGRPGKNFGQTSKSLKIAFLCCTLTISALIAGFGFYNTPVDQYRPVYLNYATMRSGISVQPAREIQNIERVYLYNNFFFLTRKNEGIHIFDNTNPSNPVNKSFIAIPGNTEISIRDSFLYADSYVDLVTLDLNNLNTIRVVDREENIYPWDGYQNVPDFVYFDDNQLDKNKGVVIGYEEI